MCVCVCVCVWFESQYIGKNIILNESFLLLNGFWYSYFTLIILSIINSLFSFT